MRLWMATLLSAGLAAAQLPIAPKAGLLYLVEDEIVLDGQRLSGVTVKHMARLGSGHTLRVVRGRAELLLQPMTFFRLAPGASVEMLSDDLAEVRVRLTGSAILDLLGKATVNVTCGGQTVAARKTGVYRFECGPDGPGLVKKRRARDEFDLWSEERSARARKMMGWKQPSPVHDPTFTTPEEIRRALEWQ